MSTPPPASRLRRGLPLLAAALATLAVTCAWYWPLPLHLSTHHAVSNFADTHVWVFDQIARMLTGREPLATTTSRAGYPFVMDARYIAWVPALLAMPFRPLFGPLGAFNAVQLLTPALSAVAAYCFLRRATDTRPWVAAAAAMVYGISPYLLSSLGNGQIEKAQLWTYPLYLMLLWEAIDAPRPWLAFGLLPLVTLALIFTCPYFGLFLPLMATPLALGKALGSTGRRFPALFRAGVALVLTAAAFLPARAYYRPESGIERPNMFRSAGPIGRQAIRGSLTPVAQPRDTLLGSGPRDANPWHTNHMTYLLMPAWVAGVGLSIFRYRGRALGWALIGLGVVMAAGPRVVIDDKYLVYKGHYLSLPMKWLEQTGYPLAEGGQYYRAIALASLGVAVLLAGGLSRLRPGWGGVAAWTIAAVAVWDGARAAGPALPRPIEPFPGHEVMSALEGDPADGAVLALPVEVSEVVGGFQLAAAALHGRSTSAVARYLRHQEARYLSWPQLWAELAAEDPSRARALLHDLGFRYLLLFDVPDGRSDADRQFRLDEEQLTTTLGAPVAGRGVRYWDLGPTRLEPRDISWQTPGGRR